MKRWTLGWMLVVMGCVMAGCPATDTDDDTDAGIIDAGIDAGLDAGVDAGNDAGIDAGSDAGIGDLPCAVEGDCGPGQRCDPSTLRCVAGEDPDPRCSTAADCLASELCHPTAKVCVQTCLSGAECPDTAKTCDALSATDSRKVCKCSTDALCNADGTAFERVCSIAEAVCIPKCTADAQCGEGQRCDTSTGHCKVRGDTGAACSGEGQSNCDYGTHFCGSNVCMPVWEPGCLNYTNFPNKDMLGTTGPILYGARQVSTSTDSPLCGAATPRLVKVAFSAYSSVPFPATKGALSGFFRVLVAGTVRDGTQDVPGSDYTVSGVNRERAELVVSLCTESTATTLSTAYYFTNGNFLCFQANF
ncbi:MAG: hypothetical protein EOO71_08355 [Myxococcaceae bacterium]|nr:MAG: hypothetical protein EOO71_08355 [Myxococcaceae bacterium]